MLKIKKIENTQYQQESKFSTHYALSLSLSLQQKNDRCLTPGDVPEERWQHVWWYVSSSSSYTRQRENVVKITNLEARFNGTHEEEAKLFGVWESLMSLSAYTNTHTPTTTTLSKQHRIDTFRDFTFLSELFISFFWLMMMMRSMMMMRRMFSTNLSRRATFEKNEELAFAWITPNALAKSLEGAILVRRSLSRRFLSRSAFAKS